MAVMLDLLDEHAADQQVIAKLLIELNRRNKMSKYFKDVDGQLYVAHSYEAVTQDDLEKHLAELKERTADAESLLPQVAAEPVVEPEQPAPVEAPAPVEPTPEPAVEPTPEPVQEAQPEQPAEAPAPVDETAHVTLQ